jgi:hypothetical protein
VVFGLFGDHHAVDQNAGDLHLTRVQRAALGNTLDLHDDDAARVPGGHGNGLRFQRQRLTFHGDVAIRVGSGAANDADVDRKALVKQVFLAVDLHQADDVDGRLLVQLAAAKTRVNKSAESDTGDRSRLACRDVAEHVCDHTLWQVVGLDTIGHGKLLHFGNQAPVTTDNTLQQAMRGRSD